MLRNLLCLYLILTSGLALANSVQGIRVSHNAEATRVVLDLDSQVEYKSFTLNNPPRLVLDLAGFRQQEKLSIPLLSDTPIKSIRYAAHDSKTFRLVFDLNEKVDYHIQSLAPQDAYPHRLVVDLADKVSAPQMTPPAIIAEISPSNDSSPPPAQSVTPPTPEPVKTNKVLPRRDIIIAIDAGHGGKDPGAIGSSGTKEKDVVLAIAKRLAKLVDAEPGMRAYMTRDRDTFISLKERRKRAQENGADMFISIHADAFHNRKAKGSSVYVLSERGASSEAAKILADRENAADLAGGISLEDKDAMLASVLLDLSQTASLEASIEVAETVLSGLKRLGHIHKKRVESAGFVVLKSPDIPSVLVETAFISNPEEERKLKNSRHQEKLAKAMMLGIRNYFSRNPIPGTNVPQQHIVSAGDTLSQIAQRYQVTMADIKTTNKLSSTTLRIGDVLTIPN
jgi:N-acetylmuramoyl-L-alanine amidase